MKTVQECKDALETLTAAEENFLHSLGFKEFKYPGGIDKWEHPDVVCGIHGDGSLTRNEALLNAKLLLQRYEEVILTFLASFGGPVLGKTDE